MQFDSFSAFLQMGGYGFYVWLAFLVSIVALAGLVVESALARRQLKREMAAARARKARIDKHHKRQQPVQQKESH